MLYFGLRWKLKPSRCRWCAPWLSRSMTPIPVIGHREVKCNFLTVHQKHVPVSNEGARSNNSSPWFNSDIKSIICERNILYTLNKCDPTPENIRPYNNSRRQVKRLIRTARRNFEINIARDQKNNWKLFYKYMNSRKQQKNGIEYPQNHRWKYYHRQSRHGYMAILLNILFSSVLTKSGNFENLHRALHLPKAIVTLASPLPMYFEH